MRLIIGGYAQGKLEYVLLKYGLHRDAVWDSVIPDHTALQGKMVVIDHLHCWIRECLLKEGCPEEEIISFLDYHDNCILISDEIGNGIVPADAFERAYRERTGRILIELAGRAEEVERVICGIGQKIK